MKPLVDVKALDKATVRREIGDLTESGALDALFVRRDSLVKAFEKLAAQRAIIRRPSHDARWSLGADPAACGYARDVPGARDREGMHPVPPAPPLV